MHKEAKLEVLDDLLKTMERAGIGERLTRRKAAKVKKEECPPDEDKEEKNDGVHHR
jgi:hypothetical protein